jgi:hypothetical protein
MKETDEQVRKQTTDGYISGKTDSCGRWPDNRPIKLLIATPSLELQCVYDRANGAAIITLIACSLYKQGNL